MALKKIVACLFLGVAVLSAATASAQTFTFQNIQYWVGTGTNESAMVITWNDGITPDSLVWGYKWNMPASGTAPTIYDMMQAIQTADHRLQTTANPEYNSPGTGDYALYSVFFDLTGKGGSPVVGAPYNLGGTENGYPPYPGDHYKEGWYTGFWGEVIGVGNPYNSGSWNSTIPQGLAIDTIGNNSWSAVSFSTDETNFTIPNPGFPTAVSIPAGSGVPVPAWATGCCFVALGSVGMLASRKRKPPVVL